jgi:predicted ribosomally synthesized peptide with SipW-like signal peptide
MQRQMLRLTLLLGVMVTLLGGTGVFAVFSDQASGGRNSVVSDDLASAADLQIAAATGDQVVTCQTFADGTTTPQFTITDFGPETQVQKGYACLRNNGSAALELTVQATSLFDSDIACTGDEAAAGDTTCGNNLAGELSPLIAIDISQVNCQTLIRSGGHSQVLDRWAAVTDIAAPSLTPGGIACIEFELHYSPLATETQVQKAQSDQVLWHFRFQGTAS